jgi:ATP-dependent Clp protease adaptor protein ClpS
MSGGKRQEAATQEAATQEPILRITAATMTQARDIMGSGDAVAPRPAVFAEPRAMADRPKRPPSPSDGGRDGTGTAVLTRTRTRKPNLYRVLLLNDDYTPMEFVVHVLERFFQKDRAAATQIMMHVHQNGVGECGVFTYEVAETKVTLVMDLARKHMHPLQCVMEKK